MAISTNTSPNYSNIRHIREVLELMHHATLEDIVQFDVVASPATFDQEIRVRFRVPAIGRQEQAMRQELERVRLEVQRLQMERMMAEESRNVRNINVVWDNVAPEPLDDDDERLRRLGVK